MIRYKMSKYVRIHIIDDSYDAIPAKYMRGYFIMHDEMEDSEYLINPTIKYYIDKFDTYKTEEEVLNEIEADLQSNSDSLKKTCLKFFHFLCRIKILVPDNKSENIHINDTLYKEGDVIDGMCISKVLSNRSYTDVYCAINRVTNCVYVIKLLNRNKTTGDNRYQKELKDMEQEYAMLQKTGHIASVNRAYDFKTSGDNHPYIILEYIEGKSLSRYMKEEAGTLTSSCCLKIIERIIHAFSSLHENKILHGDIHSANIMVTKEKAVKVIDLGMSRDISIEDNKLIKSGGAYYYMPPERINLATFKKFSKDADLSSDVYQVGLLIYFVLYNTLPFEGFTWEELAKSIKENNVTCAPLSFLRHPVPFPLIKLIKKCLYKDPLHRYGNASEILADFNTQVVEEKQFAEI